MNQNMRREDRLITDPERIREIFAKAQVLHLGLKDGEAVYVVPLSYGFTVDAAGHYCLYCHSAAEGRKISLIGEGAAVGFALDTGMDLFTAETACGYGTLFESVIGEGRATLLADDGEKRVALQALMDHYESHRDWDFPDKMLGMMQVIKIDVTAFTAKSNR
ncbi:MAG: pyridoxamine 5'-phosphate oxidase family protein [Peptococcaceae bacterium]|nr:pyridoxamine 5'-phosphate oxidase family protein [Peptococcaceae bacterium]